MLSSPLYRRFLALIVVTSIGFTAVIYQLSVPYLRAKIYALEEREARTVTDNLALMFKGDHLALEDYRRSVEGNLEARMKSVVSLAESMIGREVEDKAAVLNRLRNLVYDRGGYLWLADTEARFLVHPDPSREGKSFAGVVDDFGTPVLTPLIEQCLKSGEGFHSYWDTKSDPPGKRLLYGRLLPARGWILGTEIPMEDIEGEVAQRRERLVDELRRIIRGLSRKHEAEIFVMDAWQNVVIHSDPARENRNLSGVSNPATGHPLGTDLMAAAQRSDKHIQYLWNRPDDPERYIYQRTAWVRYSRGFDWYVVFSADNDTLTASARELGNRLLATATIFALLAMLVISTLVARFIAPLQNLTRVVNRIASGELDANCEVKGSDEVSQLGLAFNNMVAQLRELIHNLDAKVRERTRELDAKNRNLASEIRERQKAQKELARANKKLRQLSVRDPLTGLFNRRYMEETMAREFAKSERNGTCCGVVMLDVDFFKKFNDTYGHEAGDLVLVSLAETMVGHVRSGDVVCRYGGEEFIVILPDISREMADTRAEELRRLVAEEMKVTWQGERLAVTISVGVALFPEHGTEAEEVVAAADQALYRAKEAGRNRVVMAP